MLILVLPPEKRFQFLFHQIIIEECGCGVSSAIWFSNQLGFLYIQPAGDNIEFWLALISAREIDTCSRECHHKEIAQFVLEIEYLRQSFSFLRWTVNKFYKI
jgi:hypothetical protein